MGRAPEEGEKVCVSCAHTLPTHCKFCDKCGTRQPEAGTKEEDTIPRSALEGILVTFQDKLTAQLVADFEKRSERQNELFKKSAEQMLSTIVSLKQQLREATRSC